MMGDTVVVLGGAGLVGSLISAHSFVQYGCDVRVVDRRPPEQESSLHEVDVISPFSSTGPHLSRGRWRVVFALPESVAIRAIPWVLGAVSDKIVFIPTCSVQEPFYRALKDASSPPAFRRESIRCFRPSSPYRGVPSLIRLDDGGFAFDVHRAIPDRGGIEIKRMTPVAHDELMALCQALPHAAILGFGSGAGKVFTRSGKRS